MSRLLFTAIGKFVDPDRPESLSHDDTEDADFVYKCAIIVEEVVLYEEWFENPQHRVYNHNGPFVTVKMSTCNTRTILCSFEEFDKRYQQAMNSIPNFKEN